MSTTRVPPTPCPVCTSLNDAATGTDHNDPPRPGDLTICVTCGAILEFDDHLRTVVASQATLDEMDDEDRQRLQRAAKAVSRMSSTRES